MGTLYRNGVPYIGGGSGSEEASQIHYDNTKSGIPSTSVQGAIDELNNGLVSLDSTTIESFDGAAAVNAARGNPATVSNAKGGNAVGVTATLEPIQDLHGYDHPWAGGAGKNLLKNTITTASTGGVTATTNEDTSVSFNGTPTQTNGRFNIIVTLPAGTYTASGCPSGGGNSRYVVAMYNRSKGDASLGEDTGNGVTFTLAETANIVYSMYFYQNYGTYNDFRFYPQIEVGSVKTSFEPYENICPITGRTQVDVLRTGKNLCPPVTIGLNYDNNTGEESHSNTQAGSAKFPFDKDKTYVFTKNCNVNVMFFAWDAQDNFVGRVSGSNESPRVFKKSNFTIGKGTKDYDSITQIAVKFYQSSGQNIDDVVGAEYQLYEQGTEKSVTVNLGRTVYGGTLNITDGELSVETANIASYNGESIGEPWWSSMDEYVAGTTPTTGAQVVYTLAEPTVVSLTPAQIQLLTGTNVISTSADDILVRYYVSGKPGNVEGSLTYLSDEIAELDAGKTDYFVIENDTDLNTLLKSGVYRSPNTTTGVGTLVNCPVSTPFTMIVTGAGTVTTGCTQTIFCEYRIYIRRGTSSGFKDWVLFRSNIGSTVQFPSTGWTTETVNGTTYYTQTVSISSVSGNPIVGISPISGTLPTSAEQSAFDSVSYFTADDTTNTIKAYAESAPTNDFAVVVR